jgi:hypothetical protein
MLDEQNGDLRDVLAEEQSRGTRRKKFDAEERRKLYQLRRGVLKAYQDRDEVALKVALLGARFNRGLAPLRRAFEELPRRDFALPVKTRLILSSLALRSSGENCWRLSSIAWEISSTMAGNFGVRCFFLAITMLSNG